MEPNSDPQHEQKPAGVDLASEVEVPPAEPVVAAVAAAAAERGEQACSSD